MNGALDHSDQPDPDAIKMFVGQIPRSWSEKELKELFEPYGAVYQINVLRDRSQNPPQSKGTDSGARARGQGRAGRLGVPGIAGGRRARESRPLPLCPAASRPLPATPRPPASRTGGPDGLGCGEVEAEQGAARPRLRPGA